MTAAHACRASLSRLSVSRRTLPATGEASLWLNQPQLRRLTACAPCLVAQAIREHDAQLPGELRVYVGALSASTPSQHPAAPAMSHPATSSRRLHGAPGQELPQPSVAADIVSESSPNGLSDHEGRPDDPDADRSRSSQSSPPRRNGRQKKLCSFPPRSIDWDKMLGGGDLTREVWDRVKSRRSVYQQWGYVRHQYSPSERLQARRAFKSWKNKLSHVLEPAEPSSWPWRDAGKWLFELETGAAMRKAWASLDPDARRQQWPAVMLSTMHLCPDKASLVLDATLDPLPPGYAIHDVLLFVAQRLNLDGLETARERTIRAEEVVLLAAKMVEDTPAGHVPFGQRTFGLLARKLPGDQANELHAVLTRAGCRLHENTLLQFAAKLASDMAHKEMAFGILRNLADAGMDFNDARPASVVTQLLHCKLGNEESPDQSTRPFSPRDALEHFVHKGLSPNAVNSTAFLDSLCQHGEAEEAIRLALLFFECGVRLDAKAWATVFRGAKTSLKVANVVKALDVAKAAEVPYVDVLNNALHSVFYFAEMESRARRNPPPSVLPLFALLLRVYAKKFDLEPLQWWLPNSMAALLPQGEAAPEGTWDFEHSILPVVDSFFSDGDGPRLQPSPTTIAIMLRSYLRSLRQPHDVVSCWAFFKARLKEPGDRRSEAAQLVGSQRSLVHDSFILAMTGHRLARPALHVFGDMLQGQLRPRRGATEASGPVPHPAPTVLTFTVLLRGLMHRRSRALAEQIIGAMRELAVTPNAVTWNTLVRGFTSMQDVGRTVATLQDMDAAGFGPDRFTLEAFGLLRDKTRALQLMEDMMRQSRKKMMEEAEEEEVAA